MDFQSRADNNIRFNLYFMYQQILISQVRVSYTRNSVSEEKRSDYLGSYLDNNHVVNDHFSLWESIIWIIDLSHLRPIFY